MIELFLAEFAHGQGLLIHQYPDTRQHLPVSAGVTLI
jgi:hypothetical protein